MSALRKEWSQAEETAMWGVLLRTGLAGVLLAGGIGSLIYGARFHTVPVSEEQEKEIPIAPPPGFGFPGEGPPGFGPPGFPGQPPFGGLPGEPGFDGPPPMMGPPPFMNSAKVKFIVTEEEPELKLIREVTFGGVTLLASGELRRTYSGEPPSLCPT